MVSLTAYHFLLHVISIQNSAETVPYIKFCAGAQRQNDGYYDKKIKDNNYTVGHNYYDNQHFGVYFACYTQIEFTPEFHGVSVANDRVDTFKIVRTGEKDQHGVPYKKLTCNVKYTIIYSTYYESVLIEDKVSFSIGPETTVNYFEVGYSCKNLNGRYCPCHDNCMGENK